MIDKEELKNIFQTLRDHWAVITASVVLSVLFVLFLWTRYLGGIMAVLGLLGLAWLAGYRLKLSVGKKEDDENHFRRPDQDYYNRRDGYDDDNY